jgi:Erv1 / Alr family
MADVEEANRQWLDETENDLESKSRSKPSSQRGKPGAKMKDTMVSDMDRFREAMAQLTDKVTGSMFRREPLGTHSKRLKVEKIDSETGATYAMRAHTPGTPEYETRQKKLEAHMDNLMTKQRLRTTAPQRRFSGGVGGAPRFDLPANHKPVMPYRKQVQKPKLAHDIVGKVPIVRRMVKLSHEEELILDASLSFITALKVGLFRNSDQLSKSQKRALQSWLDLLRISLPPEWALHELIMDLDNNLDFISQKEQNLLKFLRTRELPRQQWSRSCTKEGRLPQNGFNCGFWKLLHVASVGIAEHRGGINLVDAHLVSKEVRVFSPLDAADAMKEFIANFFPCGACRAHFIAAYDECSNRRCVRLSQETDDASFADWQEVSKWLWEFHNDVVREKERNDLKNSSDVKLLANIASLFLAECTTFPRAEHKTRLIYS